MAKRFHQGHYEGSVGRNAEEAHDAGMISEDRGAVANLPQNVKYVSWAGSKDYLTGNLDDTKSGIDKQKNEDVNGAKRHLGVHKW